MGILGDDISIKFTSGGGDIEFDDDSDFKVISDIDNLGQAVIARLLTKRGDLFSHPEYGSDLYQLIGAQVTNEVINLAGTLAFQALEEEPRIKEVENIFIQFQRIDGQPTLVFFIEAISIDNDQPLNLVVNYNI